MVVRDKGEIESASSSHDEMAPLEDCFDVDLDEPVHGELLATRRALNIHPKSKGDDEKHEHIFRIRCHVKDKLCMFIIDSVSCANVACILVVENWNLKWHKHHK